MRKLAAATAVATLLLLGVALATEILAPRSATEESEPQRRRRRGGGGFGGIVSSADLPVTNMPYNGKFRFLRVRFDEAYGRGYGPYEWGLDLGWNHDYPRAEHNLSMMIEELTNIPVTVDERGGNIYSFTDPELFSYPFVYISEPGYWAPSEEEIKNIGEYMLKGGFIMVDDMQSDDTDAFYRIAQEAIPGSEFVILDTTHPIFNCFFQITPDDILNQFYLSRYAGTPVTFGIFEDNDPSKRLMAVINHNQDIGESWEHSNTGYVPVEQANNSYKIGMNYIICSMLH